MAPSASQSNLAPSTSDMTAAQSDLSTNDAGPSQISTNGSAILRQISRLSGFSKRSGDQSFQTKRIYSKMSVPELVAGTPFVEMSSNGRIVVVLKYELLDTKLEEEEPQIRLTLTFDIEKSDGKHVPFNTSHVGGRVAMKNMVLKTVEQRLNGIGEVDSIFHERNRKFSNDILKRMF
jgi:hypothetical protein